MKNTLKLGIIIGALALVACGGDPEEASNNNASQNNANTSQNNQPGQSNQQNNQGQTNNSATNNHGSNNHAANNQHQDNNWPTPDTNNSPSDNNFGLDENTPPDIENFEWTRIQSPCTDRTQIELYPLTHNDWLVGCKGVFPLMPDGEPSGLGLHRTQDAGKTWNVVPGWESTIVSSISALDNDTLIIAGGRLQESGDDVTAMEILWKVSTTDTTLTPELIHSIDDNTRHTNAATGLAVTSDGAIYMTMRTRNYGVMVGTVDGSFEALDPEEDIKDLFVVQDTVVAIPDERAGSTVRLLLKNRDDNGALFESVTIYQSTGMAAIFGLREINGTVYAVGLDHPAPMILSNDGDIYDESAWQRVMEELNQDVIGGVVSAIDSRFSMDVIAGFTTSYPATSWVAVTTDNWATHERFARQSLPDNSRNLGDGYLELYHTRILNDGSILVWGVDEDRDSGGYIARFGK